jgi:predicted PurR-regulated permease PerM
MDEGVPILPSSPVERSDRDEFVRRTWIVVFAIAAVTAFILVTWKAIDVVLMAFAGALLAIFLRSLANFVNRWTGVRHHWAVLLVLVVLLAIVVGASWLVATPASQQFQQLSDEVPKAITRLQEQLQQTPFGRFVFRHANAATAQTSGMFKNVADFFSITVEGIIGLWVILFCGIFFALDPELYINGFLLLFPRTKRPRTRQILYELGTNLQHWLLGQVVVMTIIGVLTWLGLMLIGVPLSGILGLIAGVLDFIPVVGPWIAAILAGLLALIKDPILAVWVAVLFVCLHLIEGHVLIPQVQKFMTRLPPVLTILALVLFARLFGFLGLLVAVPLLVVVLILVKTLYKEDVLRQNGHE